MTIKLIVGLANPGERYAKTRHNVGAWWLEAMAQSWQCTWRVESKFQGFCTRIQQPDVDCRLLIPGTFMNLSGQSIGAMAKYFDLSPESTLIAHDDVDLPPGAVKLKFSGGHGGHNGLRSTVNVLGTSDFWRLRIGVGHPGDKKKVADYVLSPPGSSDRAAIEQAIDLVMSHEKAILAGELNAVMNQINGQHKTQIENE